MPDEQKKHRLLIVEDDARSRALLMDVLGDSGYLVHEAADGERALHELRTTRHSFDLVLLDIQMPKVDGFDVARTIRSDAALCDLAIIALTALDRPEHVTAILQAGCDAYLAKPISIGVVREMVAGLLRDRSELAHEQLEIDQESTVSPPRLVPSTVEQASSLLATIVGHAELLGQSAMIDERDRAHLRNLREAAQQLRGLAEGLPWRDR